jgi:hypothetical protein
MQELIPIERRLGSKTFWTGKNPLSLDRTPDLSKYAADYKATNRYINLGMSPKTTKPR